MKLPAEWEAIRSDTAANILGHPGPIKVDDVIKYTRECVERCYTLATKPPKELTDEEIVEVIRAHALGSGLPNLIKDAFAAYHRKQSEPERVKLRAARHRGTKSVEMFEVDTDGSAKNHYFVSAGWEWLDYDGKPQEFVVRVP